MFFDVHSGSVYLTLKDQNKFQNQHGFITINTDSIFQLPDEDYAP